MTHSAPALLVNVLNLPPGQHSWQKNRNWLAEAAKRKDPIRLISDPSDPRTIRRNGIPPGQPGHNGKKTVTGDEIDMLEKELNYRWEDYSKSFIPK